jgi:hypothetical protein
VGGARAWETLGLDDGFEVEPFVTGGDLPLYVGDAILTSSPSA